MAQPRKRPLPSGVIVRQTILALGALVALPLLLYPKQLGLPQFEFSPVVGLIEWVFYLGVFSLVGIKLPNSTRIVTAGFTVVCRLCLGMVLGTLVAWTHSQAWAQTVAVVMWSYPLSVVLHVLFVPIILRPLWERLLAEDTPSPPAQKRRVVGMGPARPTPSLAVSMQPARRAYGSRNAAAAKSAAGAAVTTREPNLDAVVSYLGDYQGVRMCWIVDSEGLPLAVWQRQQYSADADFWAPIAVESADFHASRLSLAGPCRPERVEVRTNQGRMISEAVGDVWLGVLTDPDADDLIAVRLVRAREMIANYLQETGRRYRVAAEEHYV